MMTENGCSEDLPCSQQRISAEISRDHVSAEDPTKEGRQDDYWSVVENKRVRRGCRTRATFCTWARSNSSQAAVAKGHRGSRRRCGLPRTPRCSPEDRCAVVASDASTRSASLVGHAAVSAAAMESPLAGRWAVAGSAVGAVLGRAPAAEPQGIRAGIQVLHVLVSYRLIAPGSEWKLHRDWFGKRRHG